jgi:hypothetical protein
MFSVCRMCPLVVIIPLIGETVKSASILSAVADLNVDVMGAEDITLCNTIPYIVCQSIGVTI